PHLELPHPVLPHDVALREEQIVDVLRVDVRDAPGVADHLDRVAKARHGEIAVDLRQRLPRERLQVARRARTLGCAAVRRDRDERAAREDSEARRPHDLLLEETNGRYEVSLPGPATRFETIPPFARYSPTTWITISRLRGRVSSSMRATCCQVPRIGVPFAKGMVSDGPSRAART